VVDDDPEILELYSRVVEQAGYRAIRAGSGIEAIAIVEQTPPALVLLDLVMPQLDGFAVLEAIRSRSATRDVPVVVVTGQTITDADVDRLNRGVAAILSKGILTRSEIIARIEAGREEGSDARSPGSVSRGIVLGGVP
jgi:CheY-like chemotaxis protein